MDDQLFQYLQQDIQEMKSDIKTLLAFKWQLIGYSTAVSVVIAVVFQALSVYYKS